MAAGHEDYLGYAEMQGEYEGEPKTVLLTDLGEVECAWVD